MNDGQIRQKIVEQIQNTTTILVTVRRNPTVDELAAALGLTLYLNKLDKHTTAVFSGVIPPAITFLNPDKTFEGTVDSLRDFIIELDREKADHLRYKVEGDVVRIFITPYRTTIGETDLDFSQGDYNVELVFAVGVQSMDDLDEALTAHGKILHDATVVSLSAKGMASSLGDLHWESEDTSSYSEMIMTLVDGMKNEKGMVDEQIANALLTGIVAATERFSNNKTTPKSMTVAAKLMAAGANQQLIISQLEQSEELSGEAEDAEGKTKMREGKTASIQPPKNSKKKADEQKDSSDENEPKGVLEVGHTKGATLDEVADAVFKAKQDDALKAAQELVPETAPTTSAEVAPELPAPNEDAFAAELETVAPQTMAINDLPDFAEPALTESAAEPGSAAQHEVPQPLEAAPAEMSQSAPEPAPATPTEEPAPTLVKSHEKVIAPLSEQSTVDAPTVVMHDDRHVPLPDTTPETPYAVGIPSAPGASDPIAAAKSLYDLPPADQGPRTIEQALQEAEPTPAPFAPQPSSDALADVQKAFEQINDTPAMAPAQPQPSQAPMDMAPPASAPMPQPVVPSAPIAPPAAPAMPGLPPLPPMPDFSTLPPLPGAAPTAPNTPVAPLGMPPAQPTITPVHTQPVAPITSNEPTSFDPTQFRIPGQ